MHPLVVEADANPVRIVAAGPIGPFEALPGVGAELAELRVVLLKPVKDGTSDRLGGAHRHPACCRQMPAGLSRIRRVFRSRGATDGDLSVDARSPAFHEQRLAGAS